MPEHTLEVSVGNILVGKNQVVRIQSMTNTPTTDIDATTDQIIRIWKAGADFVRVTVPNIVDLQAVKKIRTEFINRKLDIPLVADIHFSPKLAIQSAEVFNKVRINPGNFAELNSNDYEKDYESQHQAIEEQLKVLVAVAKKNHTSIRVGVNHGSLSKRMLHCYGDTHRGMVESAIEYLSIFRELSFEQLIVSLKASNTKIMIYANRLLMTIMQNNKMIYPVHLGVTEAGDGEAGRIKSAIGIGILLVEGIGETIRVSLTEPPENEIPVAKKIIDYSQQVYNQIKDQSILFKPTIFEKRTINNNFNFFDFSKKPEVIVNISKKENIADSPEFITYKDNVLISRNKKFPLFSIEQIKEALYINGDKFLQLTLVDLVENIEVIKRVNNLILIHSVSEIVTEEIDKFINCLNENQMDNPVIFHRKYQEEDLESLHVKAAIDFGRPFINGYGNGIFIENNRDINASDIKDVAFNILQATGTLSTKTEYISCPSCGRTLFDLEKTTQKIRSKTVHLKGLKIAIMGCIVNGIGEMADADYGYVGGSTGKITLYRNREIVQKNIPEENAVEELINLIKANNDWVEPR